MGIAFISLIGILLLFVIPGVYLLFTSLRNRRTGSEPRCGHCGYNLTASESDRCPECGQLFIEAGITKGAPSRSRARVWGGLALILLPMLFAGLGLALTRHQQAGAAVAQRQLLQQMLSSTQPGISREQSLDGTSAGETSAD